MRRDSASLFWWGAMAVAIAGIFGGVATLLINAEAKEPSSTWETVGWIAFVAGIGLAIIAALGLFHVWLENIGLNTQWPFRWPIHGKSAHSSARQATNQTESRAPRGEEPRIETKATPEFLMGLYREHLGVQASKISQTYYGKWLTVSGLLGDVNVARFISGLNAMVLFSDKRQFRMGFEEEWVDRLS